MSEAFASGLVRNGMPKAEEPAAPGDAVSTDDGSRFEVVEGGAPMMGEGEAE